MRGLIGDQSPADNASADGSAEMVEYTSPEVRVIRLGANLGLPAGFECALRTSHTEYLVVVPHDVVLHRRWLNELVRVADADARAERAAARRALQPLCKRCGGRAAGHGRGRAGRTGTDSRRVSVCLKCFY